MGIRLRMSLLSAIVISLLYIIFAVIVYYLFQDRLESELDTLLLEEIEAVERQIVFDDDGNIDHFATPDEMHVDHAAESGVILYVIRSMQGNVLRKSAFFNKQLPPTSKLAPGVLDALLTIRMGEQNFRLRSRIHKKETHLGANDVMVQVVRSLEPLYEQVRQLAWLLVTLFPILFVSLFLLSWWMAGLTLHPVKKIMQTVDSISSQDLTTRITTESTDEIGLLALRFNALLDRVEQSFLTLKQFTADASHELRTPLTRARSHAEVALSQPRTAAEYRVSLGGILESLNDMESMLESLLLLARSDSGQAAISFRRLRLAPIVEDVVSRYEVLADEKHIELQVQLNPQCEVELDSAVLPIAISNILLNAILYTPAQGKISIYLGVRAGTAHLSICDTGPGITPADRERVFQRFVRLPASSRAARGCGLGLAIARSIVQLHHGTICISGHLPQGTCVELQLPAITFNG